jgi:putative glutamine amidotransferase
MVAIPTYWVPQANIRGWTSDAYAVPDGYVSALRRAGVWPVLLPGPDPGRPEEVLAPFSGLLLAGGGDIHPSRYGGPPHPEIYAVDKDRDDIEFDLVAAARAAGLPVLAVCRGFQVVNVAAGGTLRQHLPDEDLAISHGRPISGRSTFHAVRVDKESRLHGIVGGDTIEHCLSHHHQGVDQLGDGLRAVGWSDDGLVEAVEPHDGAPGWLVAVQWHPEVTAPEDPLQQALFDTFAVEVRAWADRQPAEGVAP